MTEERRVQLVAEVDTTRTRAGFNEIGQQAGQMAQQVTRAGEQAERAVTGVGGGASTSARNVDSASRSIIGSIQRTTAAMESGGRQTAAYYELLARQRGIDPTSLSPYLNALRSVEQAQVRTGASAAQVANAMRMVPAQLTDVATQLAGGQSPLLVLLQQGGQLRDSFGSIPATIRGVGVSLLGLINPATVAVAGIGALALAYNQGSKEADAYNAAIIMTGNAAGTSGSQLAAYASEISNTIGTQADAAKALAALTATGQVGSDNLKQFGQVAVQVQKYIGRSVEDTVKDFAELGKSPVEASLKLSESYHYLTSATYAQIKALDDQGKSDEAAEVAQKAYAAAFEERAAKMKDNLGLIESAWMSAKDSASKAWDAFLGVGRKKTPQQELAEVQSQIALAQQAPSMGTGDRSDAAEMRRATAAGKLADLQKRESELKWQVEKDEWDRRQAEISEKLRQAGLEWDKIMDTTLSKEQLREKEITAARQKGEDAGASDADIAKAINKINQKYSAVNNVTLTQLENSRNLAKEKMAGESADLDTQYKLQLISQGDYYAKKRDMQVREIDLEIPILKKQAEIAGGKEDQSAREKALGDLQVLMQRRKNIIEGASNSVRLADYDRQKAISNIVDGWARVITIERDTVDQEIALFGQSDQARAVLLAEMKVEADARQELAKLKEKGIVLSQAERAEFDAQTEAKKKEKGEVVAEQLAIAAANQLRRDNLKFSADYIADADLRAKRIMEIDAEQWQYLINDTAEGSEARKKLIEQFDAWVANRQMQPVLDRWKGVIDNLDNNFQEGFRDMLTGGQNVWSSFAKSIGNTLKTSLADALYQVFVKKYVVQIVASLAGAISGPAVAGVLDGQSSSGVGLAGSGAGGNSAISAAQAASSLYKAISGGFETLSTSVADAVQAGMYQSGMTTQIASNGSFASGAGSATSVAAGMIGGHYLGNAISNGYGIGDHEQAVNNTGVAAGTGIGYYVGGMAGAALGALIGGAAGGFLNRIFGMGDKETSSQGIRGTLSASSLSGESYANWHQDGGWFRSDKDGTDVKALTDAMVKQFTSGLATIETVSAGFASSLGVQADAIKDYSKVFDLKLTGDATKDQQLVTDFFSGIGDEIANKLVPNLADFAKSGEAASATLERLAGDFKGTDQIAQLLGRSASTLFGATGIESAKARESLIDFAGGLSTLSSEASFFNQNFLTDAERIKPVAEALDKALGSLGLETIPTTRDQFKSLINSLIDSGAAATDSGAKQLSSLLALGEAFAQVHPAADAAADAVAKAAAALQSVKDSASTLLSGVDNAFSVVQKVAARERAAIQANVDAQTSAVTKLQSLSDALRSTLNGLKSPEQKLAERESAQAQIRAALAIAKAGGALPSADSLKDALSAVSQDVSNQFGSSQDYLRDLYQTQNDIAALGTVTDSQLSVAEKSLGALQDQLKSLDAMVASAQDQVDALKGINTNGLTLVQAMQGLAQAILGAKSNPIVGSTEAITNAYQQYLGRAPDAPGFEWWQNAAANGAPISQIVDGIANSTEATLNSLYKSVLGRAPDAEGLAFWMNAYGSTMDATEIADWNRVAKEELAKKSGIPGFALGGDFSGGLRLVGEVGPEVEATGAARIHSTRALIEALRNPSSNNDALAAEIRVLRETVARQQAVLDRIALSTERHADMFENATGGGGPLLVEVTQ